MEELFNETIEVLEGLKNTVVEEIFNETIEVLEIFMENYEVQWQVVELFKEGLLDQNKEVENILKIFWSGK